MEYADNASPVASPYKLTFPGFAKLPRAVWANTVSRKARVRRRFRLQQLSGTGGCHWM